MSHQHQEAVKANIKSFHSSEHYDRRESVQWLSILNAKVLLETSLGPIPSVKAYGDFHKPCGGISADLIDTTAISSDFKKPLKIMDFACGTGLVTQKIIPHLVSGSEVVGVDITQEFLDAFEKRVVEAFSSSSIKCGSKKIDIMDPSAEVQEYIQQHLAAKFDKIFCTILYHHLHDYEEVTKKLATFLVPGGIIYIVDFYNKEVETANLASKETSGAVRHMGGLKVSALTDTFENAGLVNIQVGQVYDVNIWQPDGFIKNHCDSGILHRLTEGLLEHKISDIEGKVYLITQSVILAMGQAPF